MIHAKTSETMYLGITYAHPIQDFLACQRPTITPAQERHQAYQLHDQLYAGRYAADYANAYLVPAAVLQIGSDYLMPYTDMASPESVAVNVASERGRLYV